MRSSSAPSRPRPQATRTAAETAIAACQAAADEAVKQFESLQGAGG